MRTIEPEPKNILRLTRQGHMADLLPRLPHAPVRVGEPTVHLDGHLVIVLAMPPVAGRHRHIPAPRPMVVPLHEARQARLLVPPPDQPRHPRGTAPPSHLPPRPQLP